MTQQERKDELKTRFHQFIGNRHYSTEHILEFILSEQSKAVADVVGPLEQRQKFLNMDGCTCHIYPPCCYCEYEISEDEAIDQSLSKAKTYTEAV